MSALATGIDAIFLRSEDDFRRRISTLEAGVAAILAGSLGEGLRAAAERDAHSLSGALGTFGLARGSELAGELELRFAAGHRERDGEGTRLTGCVGALREELDGHRPAAPAETGAAAVAVAAGARILVVDDDPAVRAALELILTGAGYDVGAAACAKQARHVLEHETVDLLLSDVSMPGETGLDLIRFALGEHPGTATLLISALEDPGVAQVAIDHGAYGYLCKPVRRSAVLIGVMTALRRRDVEARERERRETLECTVRRRTTALSQALGRLEGAVDQGRVLQAETIHRWAQAAECRDPGAGRHVRRMSRYCALLGRRLGLHAERLELASVLHDVGKAAIPDSILLKPGPLTADERLAVETHADIGNRLLRDSCSSVLELAAVVAHTHHEKFDGTGYPRGLSGAEIPLEGRIAAVADVFDALTCDRVYRAAWTPEAAIEWMGGERGTHFDPAVLHAFLGSLDEVHAIRAELATD